MHPVREACERLMHASQGKGAFVLVDLLDGPAEMVLVRRGDLELLLSCWAAKRDGAAMF